MNVGDLVIWRGGLYRLLGFDPMSVPGRLVHLEDVRTGRRVSVPLAEIVAAPAETAPG